MVSDHIADREIGWMAIVKAEIHDHYDKIKQFLSYQKAYSFLIFLKLSGGKRTKIMFP
jgi:hypothetical protein